LMHGKQWVMKSMKVSWPYSFYMFTYDDVIGNFVINLVTMIHHKNYTYL
jgi:hypothetical protein